MSREAGTTRDVVEVGIDIGGFLCRVGDMAGLRTNKPDHDIASTIGLVEEEGIKRAKQRALDSHVVILVLPVEINSDGISHLVVDSDVIETAKACAERGNRIIAVINKIDRLREEDIQPCLDDAQAFLHASLPGIDHNILVFPVSCLADSTDVADKNGIQTLLTSGLTWHFNQMTTAVSLSGESSAWEESLGASERHRLLLENCMEHLENFTSLVAIDESKDEEDLDVVVAAESLRAAADCLAHITGRGESGDVEEVLGVVFEK